ncbi:hypothetical protein BH10BDE1_BH10BDE1_00170 [soil metagenome]
MVLDNPFEQKSEEKKASGSLGEGLALPLDRLAAHVADLVLLVPVMALAMAPFRRAVMDAKLLDNTFDSDWAFIQSLVAAVAVGVVWETFFISMWGTSPGRAIFGIRIVDMWTGAKPRLFHAFLRALTWWGSVLFLGAPFFGVYGNVKRRPLHDRVADTEVRSRNTRRQSAPPRIAELAAGSLFATGAIFFASLIFTSQAVVLKEHARLADAKDVPRLCEDVSAAVDTWETLDAKPTRISVALSLSAAGVVDTSCLEVEADYALWNNQGRLLGYLAKGLINYGHNMEESTQYFSKVCGLEPDSDSCRMAEWYRDFAAKAEDEVAGGTDINQTVDVVESLEKIARSMLPGGGTRAARTTAPDWMRLLVLRELFVQKGDPVLILQLTQESAKHESVGAKLVEYRARAQWRLDQKKEAKATVFAAADALPRRQRVVLTSWLCSRELYESSCTADASRACDMMERAGEEESGDFAAPAFLVASLRNAECRIEKGRATSSALTQIAKFADEVSAKKLVESVRLLRTEDRAEGLSQLRELASTADADDDLFVTEANIRLVEEMAKRPVNDRKASGELAGLRERWFAARGAKRYADWGRALFDALSRRQEWGKAAEVGILLGNDVETDRRLQSRIAIAAWRAGKQQLATELVEQLEKTRFPASLELSKSGVKNPDSEMLERIRSSGRRR